MTRYSITFPDNKVLPTVWVTTAQGIVVHQSRSWSYARAVRKAVDWMRANGDPR